MDRKVSPSTRVGLELIDSFLFQTQLTFGQSDVSWLNYWLDKYCFQDLTVCVSRMWLYIVDWYRWPLSFVLWPFQTGTTWQESSRFVALRMPSSWQRLSVNQWAIKLLVCFVIGINLFSLSPISLSHPLFPLLSLPYFHFPALLPIFPSKARGYVESLPFYPKKDFYSFFVGANPTAIDLLTQLLLLDPERRPTAEQALTHPYLAKYHVPDDEVYTCIDYSHVKVMWCYCSVHVKVMWRYGSMHHARVTPST